MKDITYNIYSNKDAKSPYIACIGFFDLIHFKHDEILDKTIKIAKEKGISSVCLTFDTKPQDYIQNKKRHIWAKEYKANFLLDKYDFDKVIVLNVNNDLINTTRGEFLEYLKNILNINYIVVGEFFKFGKSKSGSVKDLIDYYGNDNIYVVSQDNSISTSHVKEALKNGEFCDIKNILKWNLNLVAKKKSINTYFLDLNENKIKNGTYSAIIDGKSVQITIIDNQFDFLSTKDQITIVIK